MVSQKLTHTRTYKQQIRDDMKQQTFSIDSQQTNMLYCCRFLSMCWRCLFRRSQNLVGSARPFVQLVHAILKRTDSLFNGRAVAEFLQQIFFYCRCRNFQWQPTVNRNIVNVITVTRKSPIIRHNKSKYRYHEHHCQFTKTNNSIYSG